MTDLVDDVERERITHDLDATLFVEAGAGAGKTTVLVARILELVRSGRCELREIAAITFTEAAAFELRERVRLALGYAREREPLNENFARALLQIDEAAMCTIHGLCHRILAEYPLQVRLPLRFRILDEVAAHVDFDRRFAVFIDGLFDDAPARALLAAANSLQIAPGQLRLLARSLDEFWNECLDLDPVRTDLEERLEVTTSQAASLVAEKMRSVASLVSHCAEADDALLDRLVQLTEPLDRYAQIGDWLDGLRWLVELQFRKPGKVGRKDAWPTIDVADVRDALGELEQLRSEQLRGLADLVLTNLLRRLGGEAVRAAWVRQHSGSLRFHDLLVLTAELLEDEPSVRRAVRARFRRILIDEFQDTDGLQLAVLSLLGRQSGSDELEPGRLFFVGDPKQSIYRFRGADVSRYHEARRATVGDDPRRLVSNFRSVPGIIDWVNRVFGAIGDANMVEGRNGSDWNEDNVLSAVRRAETDWPPVALVGGPEQERLTAAQRRERDAQAVAGSVQLAIGESWPVRDGEDLRPARLSDIAVLVPRRTGLTFLERALQERSIPYRVESSTLIYGSDEVRDLRAVLAAVSPAGDERDIIAALRTPLFVCGEQDLLDYRIAGGSFRPDAYPPRGLEAHRVADGLEVISRLRKEQHRLGVVGVIEWLISDRQLVALQASARHRDEALRRIDFVLDRARAFSEAGGEDITSFVSLLDLEAQLNVRSIELPPPADAEESVTIMTVHSAKGLEFPIVILAELGGAPATKRGVSVLRPRTAPMQARVRSGVETASYAEALRVEDGEEAAENLRLAYVATTRARDHLVLSLSHATARSERARSIAEHLYAAWQRSEAPVRVLDLTGDRTVSSASGSHPGAVVESPEIDLDAWELGRAALLQRISRPRSVAATALAGDEAIARTSADDAALDPLPWRRPRAATATGRAVHAVLQHIDLRSPGSVDELCLRAAEEEGCAADHRSVARFVEAALSSEVVQRAARSGRCYRELPITVAIAGGLLESVIDLCFEENGSLVVVDYKTDALRGAEEISQLVARHRLQAGAYALGIEAISGCRPSRVSLLFLGAPSGAIEYEVPDLPETISAVRVAAAKHLGGGA